MPAITVDDITVLPRILTPDPAVARDRAVVSVTRMDPAVGLARIVRPLTWPAGAVTHLRTMPSFGGVRRIVGSATERYVDGAETVGAD